MPSDSNGVYTLPGGYLATTGDTIQASQHNPPLEDLASSMSARLMRSGAAPMTGPLKMTDGSVGSPAAQFANAPSTGIYKTTNGVGVSVAGTQVAEFTSGGLSKGGKFIGELFVWTGSSAPALCVLPYGQTLSRSTYADLWAFAQTEIAAGNTFYNNGNGTTTFGIGDFRGRVAAGKDDIGGTAANRIGSVVTDSGTIVGTTIGSVGGSSTHVQTAAEMPIHTHPNNLSDPGHVHSEKGDSSSGATPARIVAQAGNSTDNAANGNTTVSAVTGITINNVAQGGGAAHSILQHTIITNFALFAGA